MNEIIDGRDLILLGERELLSNLDARARSLALSAAKRVSVVTAISPRALVDIGFVIYSNIRLIRQISALYGGRAGRARLLFAAAPCNRPPCGDRRHGGRRRAAAASCRPRARSPALRPARRGRHQRPVDGQGSHRRYQCLRALPFLATSGPGIKDFISELATIGGDKAEAKDD